MPGASSMRGVTGFRVLDAINGALAQLDPDAGRRRRRGREHARDLRRRPARRLGPLHLLRARRRHLGRDARGRRQRRPHEPGEPRGEHPGRGRRVRVPDRDRALRARARQRRRRPAPRRPRGRARLALPDARHVADRALRPRGTRALRPARAASPGALSSNVLHHARRHRGRPALDVLDDDRRRRRLRPPHGRRRRLGRPARARAGARRRRRARREGDQEAALEHYGVAVREDGEVDTSEREDAMAGADGSRSIRSRSR